MRQVITIKPTGRINRRDLPNLIGDDEVLERVNFEVIGNGDDKRNRKVAGASRFSDTNTGTFYNSGIRYYAKKNVRKTFAHNLGKLYHISDNGTESEVLSAFVSSAIPCWENMRISDVDVLYVSEGGTTGMYSHDGNIANTFTKETAVSVNLVGMISHLDRMFGFEEDSEDLLFSKNLTPTNFTDSTDAGIITIGPKRGSKIMALSLMFGTLYIFKQDSIWRLIGRTPSEFQVEEVHPYLGVSGRYSVVNTDNGVIFCGSDFEFYFFGGTIQSTVMLSYKLAFSGDATKNLLPLINRSNPDNMRAVYHNKIYRCAYTGNGETTNAWEYCFNTINETDFLTYGFNISCYIPWIRHPDLNELLTGRIDLGRLMKMNIDLNVDNDATSPSMAFRLKTKFVGSDEPRNIRFKRVYFNCGVLGASQIKCFYLIDCRSARSDAADDSWVSLGETKTLSSVLTISSQTVVSSRKNLDYGKSKGQNISFQIDEDMANVDFELASISVEFITKSMKKSEKVAA